MGYTLKCPLCDDAMPYREFKDEKESTHTWICESCPGVLIEYYDQEDLERFIVRETMGSKSLLGRLKYWLVKRYFRRDEQ